MSLWLCAAGAYLLGSVNVSVWIGKLFYRKDIRSLGSGNPGTANTLRTFGFVPAAVVFAFDFCKAYFPVRLTQGRTNAWFSALTALLIVCGHCFPVFHRFRGGKGVACAFGAAAAFSPAMAMLLLCICAVLSVSVKRVSITPVITAVMMIPMFLVYAAYTGCSVFPYLFFSVGVSAVLLNRHLPQVHTMNNQTT